MRLSSFRNFERAEFHLAERGALICGDNGRGKSNLLEAVYFLAVGKSGRGASDRDIVRWGADHFLIEAEVEREDGGLFIRLSYDRGAKKKKAYLQNESLPKLSLLVGAFNAVLFSPEDVDLVLRNPSERRRLLDVLVSQSDAAYLSDLETYRRSLSQRNRLLREGGIRLRQNPDPLSPWDVQLAHSGARILRARRAALKEIAASLERHYLALSPAGERLATVYRASVSGESTEEVEAGLRQAFRASRREEVDAGHTLVGPHRDNLIFLLEGRPAHEFASKGQLKSVLLSWKLSEAAYLDAHTGRRPVLLMDDAFSELDRKRALSALGLLESFGQVLLTSARDPDLPLRDRGYSVVDL